MQKGIVMLSMIKKDCILSGLHVKDKADVIEQMAAVFEREGYLCDRELFCQDVLDREKEFPTYIGYGIALPHGKSDGAAEAGLCIARLEKEIVWDEESGDKADFIIMIAVRKSDAADLHLQILSKLSRMLMHEEFRERLKNGGRDVVYDTLQESLEVS